MSSAQSQFRTALFDPDIAVPRGLLDGLDRPAGKRFDVYRNNVVMSLKEALSQSFPVIEKLLGVQNFSSLAGLYVREHPPADPRMMLYGAEFPAFLEGFKPLAHLSYLGDVARLELAQRSSYHARDAAPIDPAVFSTLPPEMLARAQVHFVPAVHTLRSPWPILDIWHFNMTDGAPKPAARAQDVLIARQEFDPSLHALPAGGADLIEALRAGILLGDALENIEQIHPDFDFPSLLGLLLQTGAIGAVTPLNDQKD